jgi:hypothetical protein
VTADYPSCSEIVPLAKMCVSRRPRLVFRLKAQFRALRVGCIAQTTPVDVIPSTQSSKLNKTLTVRLSNMPRGGQRCACEAVMRLLVESLLRLCAVVALAHATTVAQGAMTIVALSGEEAPGPGVAFTRFSSPVLSAEGTVAFQASLAGPSTDVFPHGIWVGTPHSLRALAVAGDDAADVAVARYRTVGTPHVLTPDAATLFYGNLVQEGGVTFDDDYGIWTGAPNDVSLFARKQDQARQLPADVNYSLFDAFPHASGRIGLSASLQGPDVELSSGSAAWIGEMASPQSLQLVARAGDAAPGLPPDWRFLGVGTPVPNAVGEFALTSTATNADPAAQQSGIWTGEANELRLLTCNPVSGQAKQMNCGSSPSPAMRRLARAVGNLRTSRPRD